MLIVAEIVHHKGSGPTMYRLACKSGVLSRLYHPSYITTVAADPKILGLESVLHEWTGLPRMTERLGCKFRRNSGGITRSAGIFAILDRNMITVCRRLL